MALDKIKLACAMWLISIDSWAGIIVANESCHKLIISGYRAVAKASRPAG
jgi:hypothetical protein